MKKKIFILTVGCLSLMSLTACSNQPISVGPNSNTITPNNTTQQETISSNGISAEKAKQIALSHANVQENQTSMLRVKEEIDNQMYLYDVTFYVGNKEYDYDIAKADGTIISFDHDIENDMIINNQQPPVQNQPPIANNQPSTNNNPQGAITIEKAKQIALSKVPGAGQQNMRIKYDYDDGRAVYEGEILYNQVEYEFKIDANSGSILKWEIDYNN